MPARDPDAPTPSGFRHWCLSDIAAVANFQLFGSGIARARLTATHEA